jgi:hypothetical protein
MQIGQLDTRLKELDEERAELQQYQALDRTQRSLQYAILDQEIRDLKTELEQVLWGALVGHSWSLLDSDAELEQVVWDWVGTTVGCCGPCWVGWRELGSGAPGARQD